jgi:hypothetical protein
MKSPAFAAARVARDVILFAQRLVEAGVNDPNAFARSASLRGIGLTDLGGSAFATVWTAGRTKSR